MAVKTGTRKGKDQKAGGSREEIIVPLPESTGMFASNLQSTDFKDFIRDAFRRDRRG